MNDPLTINWFTPLPPARTDIANYSMRILPQLCQRAEVVVWTHTEDYDRAIDSICEVKVVHGVNVDWPRFHRAEHTLYNIGNNPDFHADIVRIQHQCPGTVILHDLNLHDLVCGMLAGKPGGREEYFRLLAMVDGKAGASKGKALLEESITMDDIAPDFPLTDWVGRDAHGVITHNASEKASLHAWTQAPILVTPLPYLEQGKGLPLRKQYPSTFSAEQPLELIAFGFLSAPNRRLAQVLRALGSFPERECCRLSIVGEFHDQDALRRLVRDNDLEGQVEYLGFVPEEELETRLSNAHLAINLRYPTRSEASGSQLRIWNHGLPSLVTKTGWYGQLPADCVAFVNPETEQEDIHRHLRDFMAEPQAYFEMGRFGKAFLDSRHTVDNFVEALMRFLPEAKAFRKQAVFLRSIHSIAQKHLLPLAESPCASQLSDRLAREFLAMCEPKA